MKRSIDAFRLAEGAFRGGADLKGSIDITPGKRSTNCDLKLHGNNKGCLIGAWNLLHAVIEHGTTDCTMDELIGALDILNELMEQTQTQAEEA